MARINKSVVGNLSGSLGDVVFHQRYGKAFVRRRPESFLPGTDKQSVERRNRFAFSVKLAKAIYSVPELRTLWQKAAPKSKSPFNFVVGSNTKLVNADFVTNLASITPASGFNVACKNVTTSSTSIVVEIESLSKSAGISLKKEPNVRLVYVLSLSKRANKSVPAHQSANLPAYSSDGPVLRHTGVPTFWFVSGSYMAQPTVIDDTMVFNVKIVGKDAALTKSYRDKKLLFALVTLNADGKVVGGSGTVVM